MLSLTALNECFNNAVECDAKYIGVRISIGLSQEEIIINPQSNFAEKKAYYNQAYDESLKHKFSGEQEIRITGFVSADSFDLIEKGFEFYDYIGTSLMN